ncbi:MAG TPA: dipeptide ABC transporter ATP-binding protein [Tardiphaga sp.]
MTVPLLQLDGVTKHYPVRKGMILQRQVGSVRAVDGISFALMPGETLALVGESGCGKSTTARLAMRLIAPTGGTIRYDDEDITHASKAGLRKLRREVQIVFQDPYASLNPRMTVQELLAEPMLVNGIGDAASRRERVRELLRLVDLAPHHASSYPHEFSGGQRQRIGIARALSVSPRLIVCDEPVSALDVSIQAQIVNLLKDLQNDFDLSYLFISHGLAVVKHMADRVAVMYLGEIVEMADKAMLYANPRHPYTQALLAAAPEPDPTQRGKRRTLAGDVPSPLNPPSGCRFHTRCAFVKDKCRQEAPPLHAMLPGHQVACHFAEDIPASTRFATGQRSSPQLQKRLALYERNRNASRLAG